MARWALAQGCKRFWGKQDWDSKNFRRNVNVDECNGYSLSGNPYFLLLFRVFIFLKTHLCVFGLYVLVRWGSAFLKPISCASKVAKYSCACWVTGQLASAQLLSLNWLFKPQETVFVKQSSCMFHIFVLKALGLGICVHFKLLECQEEFNILKSISKVNQWVSPVSKAVERVQFCYIKKKPKIMCVKINDLFAINLTMQYMLYRF